MLTQSNIIEFHSVSVHAGFHNGAILSEYDTEERAHGWYPWRHWTVCLLSLFI